MNIKFKHIFILPLLLSSFNVLGAPARKTLQLGVYHSNITYTEPDVMEEEGYLLGLMSRFVYYEGNLFRTLEISYAGGYMDYDGSGTIENIPNEIFEIRGLLGHDLAYIADYKISPYFGLGYRYLIDDSSDLVSSTSAGDYERKQSYFYFPIGIELKKQNAIYGWMLSASVEYDLLIGGESTVYIGDTEDLYFTQDEGHGTRISMSFTRDYHNGLALTVAPFYRYWSISESDMDYDTNNYGWVIPDNHSEEFGISLSFTMYGMFN